MNAFFPPKTARVRVDDLLFTKPFFFNMSKSPKECWGFLGCFCGKISLSVCMLENVSIHILCLVRQSKGSVTVSEPGRCASR